MKLNFLESGRRVLLFPTLRLVFFFFFVKESLPLIEPSDIINIKNGIKKRTFE